MFSCPLARKAAVYFLLSSYLASLSVLQIFETYTLLFTAMAQDVGIKAIEIYFPSHVSRESSGLML